MVERAVRLEQTIVLLRWLAFLGVLGLSLYVAGDRRSELGFYLPTVLLILYNSALSYLAFKKGTSYRTLLIAASIATILDVLLVTLLVQAYSYIFQDIYLFYTFVIIDVGIRFGIVGSTLVSVLVSLIYGLSSVTGGLVNDDADVYNVVGRVLFFLVLSQGIGFFSREIKAEREKRAELAALYETSQVASVTLDLKEILCFVVTKAMEHFRSVGAAVLLVDEETHQLRVESSQGKVTHLEGKSVVSQGEGIEGLVANNGQPRVISPKRRWRLSLDEQDQGSTLCVPMVSRGSTVGVLTLESNGDRERFDENDLRLATTFATQAATSIENIRLYHDLQQLALSTMTALASAIDAKDEYTRGHCERLSEYAIGLAEYLRMADEDIRVLKYAAALHDIGKIAINDSILQKAGPLTTEEWEIMRTHPVRGAQMVEPIDFLRDAVPLILHHHERYDGQGYPHGLAGEAIPLGARILGVVDAWEAMTSDRAYRPALTREAALAELVKNAGKQFDPGLVSAFKSWLEQCQEVSEEVSEDESCELSAVGPR